MALSPYELEIFQNMLSSIAEEMGMVLIMAGYSPNIKERRDLSCAIFDPEGNMVSQAAHIPVHLGSMSFAVKAVLDELGINEGDIFVLNDPFKGGTHLPDITCITPFFVDGRLEFFLASRAHHADVGGISPGSMPLSTSLDEEGVLIPPSRLYENGKLNKALFHDIVSKSRDPEEREGDFRAQVGCLEFGAGRLKEIISKYSLDKIKEAAAELLNYSEKLMKAEIKNIPDGTYSFEDYMDDDGAGTTDIPIRATITISGEEARVDFKGTSRQVSGCVNTPFSVTTAAVLYVFQCLASGDDVDMPLNSGPLRAIEIVAEPSSLVNATYPSAVSAGNCETSQRIVDVVLGALSKAIPDKVPAASNGGMNNVTFGTLNPVTGKEFAYYETIGGGMGGIIGRSGPSAIHSHMTNTLNTPVEAFERELPIMIDTYSVRENSGGEGKYPGGDGITRSFKFLTDTTVTVITERRIRCPYGVNGGGAGKSGRNTIIREGVVEQLPPKASVEVKKGDVLRIDTPGGGGWGQ